MKCSLQPRPGTPPKSQTSPKNRPEQRSPTCGRQRGIQPLQYTLGELLLALLGQLGAGPVVLEVAVPGDFLDVDAVTDQGLHPLRKLDHRLALPPGLGLQVVHVTHDGPGRHQAHEVH